jgi:hypothetical protein
MARGGFVTIFGGREALDLKIIEPLRSSGFDFLSISDGRLQIPVQSCVDWQQWSRQDMPRAEVHSRSLSKGPGSDNCEQSRKFR